MFALSDVVSARNPAVVAVASGQIVGAAVGRVEGDQAWLLRLALDLAWRRRGLGSTLISELEHWLVKASVPRIRALLPADETGTQAFANSGFTARPAMNRSGFDRDSISWKDRDRYVEAIPEGSP
ncbi:MAG TPA: hypothetical protein DEQ61_23120 [Streptomyces sp.]|nr:hypothetical protein [Streptomyces sp.]